MTSPWVSTVDLEDDEPVVACMDPQCDSTTFEDGFFTTPGGQTLCATCTAVYAEWLGNLAGARADFPSAYAWMNS